MIISFFINGEYTVGVDYSEHPDLVFQGKIPDDFDFSAFEPRLVETDGKYEIIFEKLPPPPETEEEKRTRIFQKFISSKILDDFDWEGIEPTEQDYNNLIILRNFSGDAGSQVTMITKAVFKILAILADKKVISIEELATIFQEDLQKTKEISETRVALGLNPFDFSFLSKK